MSTKQMHNQVKFAGVVHIVLFPGNSCAGKQFGVLH